jgi:hypothetical protein
MQSLQAKAISSQVESLGCLEIAARQGIRTETALVSDHAAAALRSGGPI